MEDKFNLQRFVEAQKGSHNSALKEIKNGKKQSHWMWYVFPQLKGLGRSSTSQFYGIGSKAEAKAYLHHPILGARLIEITNVLLTITDKTALEIFGQPDDLKLKSSMTLFALVAEDSTMFISVLEKYYDGKLNWKTKEMIEQFAE